jgi:hypothetical protein
MRAIRARYNPYVQVNSQRQTRVLCCCCDVQLLQLGQVWDRVELLAHFILPMALRRAPELR